MENHLTYESAYAELQQIAADIENETITVDQLAEKVKRAALLIEYCQARLRSTEAEVSKIIGQLE
ncbi:exodeoxyribonuclease VII small subunit [Flavihumibacter stibioxidans]|uniref:Exodeoxyribonuclease VII small subunit n=2 Tax=Flavihumibacter stibioxidans TaxID=1834163 RepID=A0ABR7M937_9BACT|nr:exodeoxyribonuclease VII small subunit [Flavihumibacter stibioxidans]